MSKKPKKTTKNTTKSNAFTYTKTNFLPKLGKIQTAWDLKGLYYKDENDPQIERDIQKTEKAYRAFAKKWRKRKFTANAKVLKEALTEYEKLAAMPEASKPGRYFSFRSVLDAKDAVADKRLSLLSQRMRKLSDEVLFFGLEIGKIPRKKQSAFLRDSTLAHFHYYLERAFLSAQHDLSEAEEKIINLKSRQSSNMWANMVEKLIANRSITFKGKQIPIVEALELIDTLKLAERKKLWTLIIDEMEKLGEVSEHEFNALIMDVRTEDELRDYKKPYSATALSYEDTEKSIENLVSVVSKKGFELSQKFYKLKAKYHGVPTLHYTQKYETIGTELTIPFEQAVSICRDVFYGVKKEYGEIFDKMLTRGQIDVYPKAGKRGGAFMSSAIGHPTHVFLNHVDKVRSLETLAHEMGHAIHSERSKVQTPFYEGHSITTAETASTLFENLLFDAVYEQAEDHEKMVLLHDRITRDISTIQRQIAFFNCELEIHTTIKEQGSMTNEELAVTMHKHLKAYLGSAIELDTRDGYSYVYIPHLRYGFYVYTYAFGILMSTIMANRFKEDKGYAEDIDRFLTSGQSATVADIFKSIDIDTSKKATFERALQNHEDDIRAFEKFVRKNGPKK